jgi:hypothetical protein
MSMHPLAGNVQDHNQDLKSKGNLSAALVDTLPAWFKGKRLPPVISFGAMSLS